MFLYCLDANIDIRLQTIFFFCAKSLSLLMKTASILCN